MEREKRRDGENGMHLLLGGVMERERLRNEENGVSLLSSGEMERQGWKDGENGMLLLSGGEMEREKGIEGENSKVAASVGELGSERRRDGEKSKVADSVREIEDGELMDESLTSDGEMTITGEVEVMDMMELSKRVRVLEKCYDMLENRVQKCESSFLPSQNARTSQKKITKEEMIECMKGAVLSLGTERYGVSRNQMKKFVGDAFGMELSKSSYYSKKFSILLKKAIDEKLLVYDSCHGLYSLS